VSADAFVIRQIVQVVHLLAPEGHEGFAMLGEVGTCQERIQVHFAARRTAASLVVARWRGSSDRAAAPTSDAAARARGGGGGGRGGGAAARSILGLRCTHVPVRTYRTPTYLPVGTAAAVLDLAS
jgi:succinyl-CoA synthetase alpha subunit